jgi:hypothetical protein
VTGHVFIYEGLYLVVERNFEKGKSNFKVVRDKLRRDDEQELGSMVFQSHKNRTLPKNYPIMSSEEKNVFLFNDVDSNTQPMDYDYILSS